MDYSFLKKINPYQHWEYLNLTTNNRLRIVPERGGLIAEWRCKGKEVLYLDKKRFADTKRSVRGGIPILFPICGDLFEDKLSLPDGDFILGQHGFARDNFWTIALLDDYLGIQLTMAENEKTLSVFPFSFFLQIEARLIKNALELLVLVENRSKKNMPFSFGFHPYFNISDLNELKINGLPRTCINQKDMNEVSTRDQISFLDKGVDFMTYCQGPVQIVDCVNRNSIKLEYQQPFAITVVWTDPPRNMICVEPWTSPRQSLITGNRRLLLQPGSRSSLKCRLTLN